MKGVPKATGVHKLDGSFSNKAFLNAFRDIKNVETCLVIMSKNGLKLVLLRIVFKKFYFSFNYDPITFWLPLVMIIWEVKKRNLYLTFLYFLELFRTRVFY